MKALSLTIILSFISCSIFSQEIELNGKYSYGTTNEFNNNIGYGIGYFHHLNNNRLGISYSQDFCNTPYDNIYNSLEDGISKYIKEYEPNNTRLRVNLTYSYNLLMNPKSKLYIGCTLGINYYLLRGEYDRIENGLISAGHFDYNYSVKNRLGFGFLLEYELTEIIHKRLSTSIRIQPEITSYEKFMMVGSYDPWIIGWLNFELGVKYKLNNKL